MSVGYQALTDAVQSHALASGYFDAVNGHEPKSSPANGLSAAVWVQSLAAYPGGSGLNSLAGVVVMSVRIYTPFLAEPVDLIDPRMTEAADVLLAAYAGDFELGGLIRNVDLAGEAGQEIRADAGYLSIDNKVFRVITITLPLIINDLWPEVA